MELTATRDKPAAEAAKIPHVSVCVCTYKRPEYLRNLLEGLRCQKTDGLFTFSIVVADNDRAESARELVAAYAARTFPPVTYCVQPEQNIALTRNVAICHATGNYIAFIDDDEAPVGDWLLRLWRVCNESGADGVLGPVLPQFEKDPPRWVTKGGFFDRPRHETGFVIPCEEGRTGNLLFKRSILEGNTEPFLRQFGGGGEDRDFFRRMMAKGRVFVWCDEAVAYETVPAHRWKRSFMLRRALLRGKMSLNYASFRRSEIAKSLIAASVYALALPFLFVAGQHFFMKYLIRLCDHAGKVITFAGFNPVKQSYVTE